MMFPFQFRGIFRLFIRGGVVMFSSLAEGPLGPMIDVDQTV